MGALRETTHPQTTSLKQGALDSVAPQGLHNEVLGLKTSNKSVLGPLGLIIPSTTKTIFVVGDP